MTVSMFAQSNGKVTDDLRPDDRQRATWRRRATLGRDTVCKALGDWCSDLACVPFKRRVRKAAMNTVAGTEGGYLVPQALMFDVDAVLEEEEVFHQLATCFDMPANGTLVPSYDVNSSHATGDSPLWGGLGLAWATEGSAMDVAGVEKEPSFQQSNLVAKNLYGLVVASDQLVEDGGEALGVFLTAGFARAISWAVERACFRGTVANQPEGVIESASTVGVARAGAGAVASADLSGMVKSLLPGCFTRAVWCCHPTVLSDVAKLSAYQVQGSTPGNLCGYVFSRPLYVTEKVPSIGGKGDIVLFDPSQYALGRRQVEVAASALTKDTFNKRQTIFRLIWRGDGQFMAKGTATLENNASVAGVSVVLNA